MRGWGFIPGHRACRPMGCREVDSLSVASGRAIRVNVASGNAAGRYCHQVPYVSRCISPSCESVSFDRTTVGTHPPEDPYSTSFRKVPDVENELVIALAGSKVVFCALWREFLGLGVEVT